MGPIGVVEIVGLGFYPVMGYALYWIVRSAIRAERRAEQNKSS
jgi:hypothetical protein